MWSLVTSRGQRVPLRRLPAVLGSDADAADVVLPHPSIAPRHARVAEDGERLHVEALDGAALEVGGGSVPSADLAHGDELVLGRVRLTLADDRAAARAAPVTSPPPPADDDGELVLRERRDGGSSAVAAGAGGTGRAGAGGRAAAQRQTGKAGAAAGPGRPGRSAGAARERGVLVVERGERRRGLLHADLSQLGGPGKALVVLAVLVLAAAVLWGVQAAVAAFG